MNPELRMMWMSNYNPDRITSEDAALYFGHPSMGLSVMDDVTHQPQMDLNPMMSLVGGDFSNQAAAAAAVAASSAAAAAALGVQPTTLITANPNDFYNLAQMGGLQQQLLQQSATAAAFQSFTGMIDDDDGPGSVSGGGSGGDDGKNPLSGTDFAAPDDTPAMYDTMDDAYDGMSGLGSKQEIINIDDFVMMTDSNSFDDPDFMHGDDDKDVITQSPDGGGGVGLGHISGLIDTDLHSDMSCESGNKLMRNSITGTSGKKATAAGSRTQRKTRKIEPVNRPGLVLKTPIAYKGNIDPSVIPISKEGMGVCERCGAIGVKHTFYTKSRRFCSMSCARGELYNLVVNNKMPSSTSTSAANSNHLQASQSVTGGTANDPNSPANNQRNDNSQLSELQTDSQSASDLENALRVAHIKNTNYHFKLADRSNGTGDDVQNNVDDAEGSLSDVQQLQQSTNGDGELKGSTARGNNYIVSGVCDASSEGVTAQAPKSHRLYRDVIPHEDLPQIPKFDRLPVPAPQLEKIISVRRRVHDPTHSFDWTSLLSSPGFYAAPVTCFPHTPGYEVWDNVGIDMKVEVENTDCDTLEVIQPGQTPHSFWVATILNIQGYKALMRYEGFEDASRDFWANLCNAEVHSVGWCATRGKPLIPPRSIRDKYSDWKDFLVARLSGARTLPSNFYNKIHDSMQSRFRIGLNLECVDKDCISQVRLATVTKIVGKRLFLRYFDSEDGFWCHEDAPIIHPVGWATTVGHNLAAPQDYLERMLAGREAMIEVHEDDATIELFKMNFTFEEYYTDNNDNSFVEGMKLEAVDPLNLSSICAATVMAVLKFGYMMIRIDSYVLDVTGSDWFCYHEKSPSIFPVGFCAANKISLTPPSGYEPTEFNWETYLQETGSVAAGEHLFHRDVPDHGFEVGMSLECADLMDPRLVCVAKVARVVGRLLKIHFDGWTEEYDQWLDCESPDVYPVGWCVHVGHKLEGPPVVAPAATPKTTPKTTPKAKVTKKRKKKVSPKTAAANGNDESIKSRKIALKSTPHLPKLSIKLELKPEHQNSSFYDNEEEEEDYDENSSSHRSNQSTPLLTSTNNLAALDDVVSGPKNRQQLITTTTTAAGIALQGAAGTAATATINATSTTTATTNKKSVSPAPPSVGRKATSYIGNSSVSNSKYIPRLADLNDDDSSQQLAELQPETWNVYDVMQFFRVNGWTAHCDTFSRNKIDGKRLLHLTKDEIITLLGMKVGPAVKINDLIQQLKCKVNPGKSRLTKSYKGFL